MNKSKITLISTIAIEIYENSKLSMRDSISRAKEVVSCEGV